MKNWLFKLFIYELIFRQNAAAEQNLNGRDKEVQRIHFMDYGKKCPNKLGKLLHEL
jgi:hypothetical protein